MRTGLLLALLSSSSPYAYIPTHALAFGHTTGLLAACVLTVIRASNTLWWMAQSLAITGRMIAHHTCDMWCHRPCCHRELPSREAGSDSLHQL
jgi:hypothetical protein